MSVLASLLPYVLLYKYYAIFIITFLGAFALPLPSGSILMAAAAFSVQGYLNFWAVLAVGVLGNMAGDSSGYWLVRLYGLKALKKLGLARFFGQEKLDGARRQINRHPILTIYFTRFLTAVAPAVNVVSGISGVTYKRFLTFEALGELTEVSCFCVAGYLFGANWEYLSQFSGKLWILLVGSLLLSYMVWRVVFHHK